MRHLPFGCFFVNAISDFASLWSSDECKTSTIFPLSYLSDSFFFNCYFKKNKCIQFKHLLVKFNAPFLCTRSGSATGAITSYTLLNTLHFYSFLFTSFTHTVCSICPQPGFRTLECSVENRLFHELNFHAVV